MIRKNVQELLNDYIQSSAIIKNIDEYIVPLALGERAGMVGALAQQAV